MINQIQRTQRTKAECIEIVSKYATSKEWIKSEDFKVYKYASKYGWLNECCAHMKKRHVKHSKEECIASARKYSSRVEWGKSEDRKSYSAARKYGWLEECCAHMILKCSSHTKEECLQVAKRFTNSTAWLRDEEYKRFYFYAHKRGWLNECCEQMGKGKGGRKRK